MQVLQIGNKYNIISGTPLMGQGLPPKVFRVNFSPTEGFSLSELYELKVPEEKIYGPHEKKADKIVKSFQQFSRNLGVILSGRKGSGKTLVAKLVCQKANLPVILVDEDYDDLVSFLNDIEQEVVVLVDEFEKNLPMDEDQTQFLSLFDGTDNETKKLFIITCNKDKEINRNFFNRPGRIHYHIRFDQLAEKEVREYLEEKVKPEYHDQIASIVSLLHFISLNYDCLRAIAFELNTGYPAREALQDLNIDIETWDISSEFIVRFKDKTSISKDFVFDSSVKRQGAWLEDKNGDDVCFASFLVDDLHFSPKRQAYLLDKEAVKIGSYDDDDQEEKWGNKDIDYAEVKITPQKSNPWKLIL